MPIFRFLSLGNETPNLVFETQKRLVFLGLKTKIEPVPFLPSLDVQISNNTNFEAKRELFPSASQRFTGASK